MTEDNIVLEYENGSLSMKYDEKFIYFYVRGDDYDPESDKLYIPIDITPKSGSTYCQNYDITFERPCDFVISIDGRNNSRIVVQERYEALKSTYWENYYLEDPYIYPPEKNSPQFVTIDLAMKVENIVPKSGDVNEPVGEKYETGILRYGNANPKAYNFDSLADFMFTDDGVEIRVPYELLNFLNPSEMMIHDDYYECYGIEGLHIDSMYVGFAYGEYGDDRIDMTSFELEGWGKTVTYHERLKRSYYILRDYWAELDENSGKS